MATATEPVILVPQLTREGLRKLWELNSPGGLSEVISHVGLTSTAFEPTAEMTSLPGEIDRWPILDGEEIEGDEPQFNLYVEYPYDGADKVVRGYGLYLSDGTLLATHSAAQLEGFLSKQFMLDSFIHLILTGAPADTVTIVNTGVRFNPGLREFMLQMHNSFGQICVSDMQRHVVVTDEKRTQVQLSLQQSKQLDEQASEVSGLKQAVSNMQAFLSQTINSQQLLNATTHNAVGSITVADMQQ